MSPRKGWLRAVDWRAVLPRLVAPLVGLVFLAASLSKATNVPLFIRQIEAYGILSQGMLVALIAWGLIALECVLGVGLLAFYRPRVFLASTAGLLLLFLALTTWAWVTGSTEACGCFGTWMHHTPGEEAVENVFLLLATLVALAYAGHREWTRNRGKAWAVWAACLIGLALPVALGFRPLKANQSQPKVVDAALVQSEVHGPEQIDLNHGSYLVVLLSMDCLHCQEAVSKLNDLAQVPDLPPIVALCTSDESECETFVEAFQPDFPIAHVSDALFWQLLGDGDVPRILLLCDRQVEQAWDHTVPDENMIRAKLPLQNETVPQKAD
jgi:hypothetical protein